MSTTPAAHTAPQTLRGIKRKAKNLKGQGITHLQALDLAAQASGYQNFHHARRALDVVVPNHPSLHSIYLSAYWHDRDKKPSEAGLEVIRLDLPRPMLSFITKYQVSLAQNLQGFSVVDADHLEMLTNAENQERAKERLTRAALSLQFIEATGVRPATTQTQRRRMSPTDALPGRDHRSFWIEANTECWLVLDEPYGHINRDKEVAARQKWATDNGMFIAKPAWSGLYYPDNAVPHFVSQDRDFLVRINSAVEGLSALPVTTVTLEHVNPKHSYYHRFLSPATKASGRKRKPRLGTTYGYSKGATELFRRPGWPIKWRPKTGIDISKHKEIAMDLNRLCISPMTIKANRSLGRVRSTLEDWMNAEHSAEGRDNEFYNTYYGHDEREGFKLITDQLQAIKCVETLLSASYEDCKPKRDMLKELLKAMTEIEKNSAV